MDLKEIMKIAAEAVPEMVRETIKLREENAKLRGENSVLREQLGAFTPERKTQKEGAGDGESDTEG